ncbi:MAG: hypothetical protein HYX89_01720, partial [Chloroflexi bacterium]|nr:hypothetical protein [Chloroflexota bacterium]
RAESPASSHVDSSAASPVLAALPGQEPLEATTSLIFADGSSLNMARTFMGHVHFVSEEELPKRLGEFGIEPLSDEFTAAGLQQILAKKGRLVVKSVLMDQALIAGLGNVYSDEALHAAGIHPARKAASLSEEEVNYLHAAIRAVLQESINLQGERGYVDLSGREGSYVPRIHGAEACGRCGGPAEWALFGGRKGYFCPRCQPL